MINKFNGYEETQAANSMGGEFQKLPAGGYEAEVKNVRVGQNSDGSQRLEILVDITEGEFKGYFKQQFDNSNFEDKKYKGIVRYSIPQDNGTEKDNYKKRFFKGMIKSFEESNSGYKWNWNEQSLKGLKIGIYVREKEWDYNGKHGFSPEIFSVGDIHVIQRGEFEIPKPKYLNGSAPSGSVSASTSAPAADFSAAENDDYPF